MEYNLTLKTPPAIEPITLAEAKKYLKLDDGSYNGISTAQSIKPSLYAPGTTNGAYSDVLGNVVTVNLNAGVLAADSTLNVTMQESDDCITWTTFDTFDQVTTANHNQVFEMAYTGSKQYIRAVGVVAIGNASYSVDIITTEGDASDDAYIEALIKTAREYCEDFQNRAYITQTWELAFDYWTCSEIELPKGMLQTIDSIKYKNSAGATTTLTADTDYVHSTRGILGRVKPAYGKTWPAFTPYPLDAVVFEYTCGYGDAASDVPGPVIQAMYLLISHWFENRIPVSIGMSVSTEIEFTVKTLLRMNRIAPS